MGLLSERYRNKEVNISLEYFQIKYFKMYDLMEAIDYGNLDFLLDQPQEDASLNQYQETQTQGNGTMIEDNMNQIQVQPIQYQANGTISLQLNPNLPPITIEPKTLQELGINEVLAGNVPISPVDSGNGTHDSDSGHGSDKDFVMDENSVEDSDYSEGEERKKKKNVKTGKNSGKKLKWGKSQLHLKIQKKEAKRQRAIQARKNRERSNLKKESLQE